MESGVSGFSLCGRVPLVLVTALFVAVSGAAAQQPASNTPPGQSTSPAELPAAQPISQAATNASGQSSTTPSITPEVAKDSPDQSALVKLGVGDLIEVNVYNVPELATQDAGQQFWRRLPSADRLRPRRWTDAGRSADLDREAAGGRRIRSESACDDLRGRG